MPWSRSHSLSTPAVGEASLEATCSLIPCSIAPCSLFPVPCSKADISGSIRGVFVEYSGMAGNLDLLGFSIFWCFNQLGISMYVLPSCATYRFIMPSFSSSEIHFGRCLLVSASYGNSAPEMAANAPRLLPESSAKLHNPMKRSRASLESRPIDSEIQNSGLMDRILIFPPLLQ